VHLKKEKSTEPGEDWRLRFADHGDDEEMTSAQRIEYKKRECKGH